MFKHLCSSWHRHTFRVVIIEEAIVVPDGSKKPRGSVCSKLWLKEHVLVGPVNVHV